MQWLNNDRALTANLKPEVIFWDCDGVLANNSEALAMPIAGIILNEAMKALHPGAPQFDIDTFTTKYAGGHFSQFYKLAEDMLKGFDASLQLLPEAELDLLKVSRTVEVLSEKARPAADLSPMLRNMHALGFKQLVVSSSELNRVLPCVEKIVGYDFGGSWSPMGTGRVISAADTIAMIFGERRVKPMPDVAGFSAMAAGIYAERSIKGLAIEDSASGAQCWKNDGIPFIGYVGGEHILDKDTHAKMLLEKGALAVFDNFKEMNAYVTSLKNAPSATQDFKATTLKANPV